MPIEHKNHIFSRQSTHDVLLVQLCRGWQFVLLIVVNRKPQSITFYKKKW